MSEFFFPFLQGAGVLVAGAAGFMLLEFGLHTLSDRLTAARAGNGGW